MLCQKFKDRRQLPVLGGHASVRDRNWRILKPATHTKEEGEDREATDNEIQDGQIQNR